MPEPFLLAPFRPEDDPEAMELDRVCAQGGRYRMTFRRPTFARRAESYDHHHLVTARVGGTLVGVAALAVKDVVLAGEALRAGFGFDVRVHPDYRRRGLAGAMRDALVEQVATPLDLIYAWCIDDNRAVRTLIKGMGATDVGGYECLVVPTHRDRPPACRPAPATLSEVHEAALQASGPPDFYTDPRVGGRLDGHVASWLLTGCPRRAGCSAWDASGILAEVMETLPLPLRVAGALTRAPGLSRLSWPHIPSPGEALRSWILFDAFATDGEAARDLVRHVTAEARARGIDYCHLVHGAQDRWVDGVRADHLRLFSPTVPYRLLVKRFQGTVPPLERVHVDVRDL